jgi:hypothetical protein
MQTIGYIQIDSKKLLILVRQAKYARFLKLRKTGKDGAHFTDEELFLEQHRNKVEQLLSGQVVRL